MPTPDGIFATADGLELVDLREILRNPLVPTGRADVHGEGTFADRQFHGTGIYAGRDIALPYDDFHARGLTSHGTFTINNDGLVVPDFYAGALGGTVKGRVTLRFAGLQFHAETHVQDVRLANLLPSIEHHGFPIDELHWDADLTADTKEDWTGAFEHFGIVAKMHWAPPENVAAGHEAVDGRLAIRLQVRHQSLHRRVRQHFKLPQQMAAFPDCWRHAIPEWI